MIRSFATLQHLYYMVNKGQACNAGRLHLYLFLELEQTLSSCQTVDGEDKTPSVGGEDHFRNNNLS